MSADRSGELTILDSIYAAAEGYPFLPFRDKSHDLTYEDCIGFFETVAQENSQYLKATAHLVRDGSDPERVEAVQSAVLSELVGSKMDL